MTLFKIDIIEKMVHQIKKVMLMNGTDAATAAARIQAQLIDYYAQECPEGGTPSVVPIEDSEDEKITRDIMEEPNDTVRLLVKIPYPVQYIEHIQLNCKSLPEVFVDRIELKDDKP